MRVDGVRPAIFRDDGAAGNPRASMGAGWLAEAGRGLGLSDQCELLGVAAMLPLATAIRRDYFGLTKDALDD